MKLIKTSPQKIIDIENGMMALYTNYLRDGVEIAELTITYYVYSENIFMYFCDIEANELWEHLCNLSTKLPNARESD